MGNTFFSALSFSTRENVYCFSDGDADTELKNLYGTTSQTQPSVNIAYVRPSKDIPY